MDQSAIRGEELVGEVDVPGFVNDLLDDVLEAARAMFATYCCPLSNGPPMGRSGRRRELFAKLGLEVVVVEILDPS